MLKAKGPLWHKKDKAKGIIPPRLRGIDKEATWSTSAATGWVYGHGSFSMVSHNTAVLGCFLWMPNSANEARRMYEEARHYKGLIRYLVMDRKADSRRLFDDLRSNYRMRLFTVCRRHMNKTPLRRQLIAAMKTKLCRKYIKERGHTVEPMQGLVKDIFDLTRCWMRGNANNRWLFAAMGIAVSMHQLRAYKEQRSTWKIKAEVLGEL